jgi:NAD(P)H-flavin reductase/ferredoxin
MPTLQYQDLTYACAPGETVLDCLTRQGASVPSSCRSGVCQTCLMRATKGAPPAAAQAGLKLTLREQRYFLACLCKPQEDMQLALAGEDVAPRTKATVLAKEALNADIVRLSLECHQPLDYRVGQFAHITRGDGLTRSYSLTTLPNEGGRIEFHVRRLPDGEMSGWIHESLCTGDTVEVAGPFGNCFYVPGSEEQGLLLIGTGSGLAPLSGIVLDALLQGHSGPIRLYHGSWKPEGLYLVEELRQISAVHPNFEYFPCVDAEALPGYREGRADQAALADVPNLKGWRVYLCGHPEMVKAAKKRVFLAGTSMQDIYADPFVLSVRANA